MGGQYAFEDLNVSFVVDEDIKNWTEVFDWMESIGNMRGFGPPVIAESITDDFFSDILLMVTNSAYQPKYYVQFRDAFPIALSGIEFNSTALETEPIVANATFSYTSYKITSQPNA